MNLVEAIPDILVFLAHVSIAFFIGILVGWVWKPRWVSFANNKFGSNLNPNQYQNLNQNQTQNPHQPSLELKTNDGFGSIGIDRELGKDKEPLKLPSLVQNPSCSSSVIKKEENHILTDHDLKHLWHLVEKRDGGPPWKHMMDRSTPMMTYQAWQRDPETGPPQYCSKTVYEDATPELLRDFFWDDDLRLKWDDMLLHASTLEEFPTIGASVVHWIRRFPFFCSDREYTIARRIWELDGSFYCVTKGVLWSSVPRKQKPHRVDVYYSSWFIRSVRSKKGNNHPATEVIFFHHEDMGIPWEIAKFGVRQGMWGTARKVEQGLRWYQKERGGSKIISRHVVMARMSTKIDQDYLNRLESESDAELSEPVVQKENQGAVNMAKLLVIGGVVILLCGVDRRLMTKAAVFRVAKRLGNIGRRAFSQTPL